MDTFFTKIIAAITASFLILFSIASLPALQERVAQLEQRVEQEQPLGAFNTVAGKNYFIYGGGVGTSDTSITLTKFTHPVTDYLFSMSDFGGTVGYLTLEPSNANRQEFVSFTGITQNGDGTATLTGVTRGLAPVSPYTASSTLQKQHPGGSLAVISNPPQLYEQFAARENDETISGSWTFTTVPTTTSNCATANALCRKAYVDSVVAQGAATSTETNGGIVELATSLEQASSTDGGADKPLVLQAKNATTTPGNVAGNYLVVSKINRKIDQVWLDLTEAFTWTANHIFNGGGTATTTFNRGVDIDADSDTPLILNGTSFIFSTALSSVASSSPLVLNAGSPATVTAMPFPFSFVRINNPNVSTAVTSTTTIDSVTIPANTLSTAGTSIEVRAVWEHLDASGSCFIDMQLGNGTASSTVAAGRQGAQPGHIETTVTVFATSSSHTSGYSFSNSVDQDTWIEGHLNVGLANQMFLSFRARHSSGAGSCNLYHKSVRILTPMGQ